MNTEHIHICNLVDGQTGSLYYYQGNFYHPLTPLGRNIGKIKGGIRKFMRDNRALVESDRAHPEYRTLVELMDAQMEAL